MVGIVKKIDGDGFGIIAAADGSRIPFICSDIMNRHMLEAGARVIFSIRMVRDTAFAQDIMAVPDKRLKSV
jgi:cold shock CspA family protein